MSKSFILGESFRAANFRMGYGLFAASFVLSLLALSLAPLRVFAFSGSGSGTLGSPYLITNCTQFMEIDDDTDAYYRLTASINCSSNGNNIVMNEFDGHLDGDNFTITIDLEEDEISELAIFLDLTGTVIDLTIAGSVEHTTEGANGTAALAAVAEEATLTNVNVTASVSGEDSVGAVVADLVNSTATNVTSSGTITGEDTVGGLYSETLCGSVITGNHSSATVVGSSEDAGGIAGFDGCEGPGSTFTDTYFEGTVTLDGDSAGGLIGRAYGSNITDSYVTGDITGIENVGGLVGYLDGSQVTTSYATGDVSGDEDTGGLVGEADYSDILQSYATGDVEGSDDYIGGLVGYSYEAYIIESFATGDVTGDAEVGGLVGELEYEDIIDSYARGTVTGTEDVGGLVGYMYDGDIYTSYSTGEVEAEEGQAGGLVGNGWDSDGSTFWDVQTSGQEESESGTGKTTAEMKTLATFTDLETEGLDEEYVWDFIGMENDDEGEDDVWGLKSTVNNGYPCLTWYSEGCVIGATTGPGPNNGDANNDGIVDSEQSNVQSFISGITDKYAALEVSEECTINEVGLRKEVDLTTKDSGYEYPNGLMRFDVDCGDPGFTATIVQYYYDLDAAGMALRKYNTNTNAYFAVTGATIQQLTIDGHNVAKVTYQVTDGGALDMDGEVNGVIVDPAGLAQTAVGTPNTGFSRRD